MAWNILLTASPLSDSVGSTARTLLGGPEFTLVHPPKYGPFSEEKILPLLAKTAEIVRELGLGSGVAAVKY